MSSVNYDWGMDVIYNWDQTNPSWKPTKISSRLWIGGTPNTDVVVKPGSLTDPWSPSVTSEFFDACVTLTPIAGPVGHEVVELRVPLIDQPGENPDRRLVETAVQWVVDNVNTNKNVLVRCHAGLNRSGLVAVPALTFIEPSLSFDEALAKVRSLRHAKVLSRLEFLDLARKISRENS